MPTPIMSKIIVGSGDTRRHVPNLYNETFEAAGYDVANDGENVDAGATLDEDYATSNIGSPAGWGNQCLRVATDAPKNCYFYKTLVTNPAISYLRICVRVVAHNLTTSGQKNTILTVAQGASSAYILYVRHDGTNVRLTLRCYHDGASHYYSALNILSLNTPYRVEVKWDAISDKWVWRIDGVDQPNDQDAVSPITAEGLLTSTHVTSLGKVTVGAVSVDAAASDLCVDNLALDTMAWIGA